LNCDANLIGDLDPYADVLPRRYTRHDQGGASAAIVSVVPLQFFAPPSDWLHLDGATRSKISRVSLPDVGADGSRYAVVRWEVHSAAFLAEAQAQGLTAGSSYPLVKWVLLCHGTDNDMSAPRHQPRAVSRCRQRSLWGSRWL